MRILFFFIIFISSALSEEACYQNNDFNPKIEGELNKLALGFASKGYLAAVSEEQIRNGNCLEQGKLNLEDIRKHFNKNENPLQIKKEVFGIHLQDTPKKIDLLKKLLSSEDLTANLPPASQKSFSHINCQNVDCAAKEIFGEESGMKMLYALDKYGMNLSHLRYENTRPWTDQEFDEILEGLDDFPETLLPVVQNQTLVRHAQAGDNTRKTAEPGIVLFGGYSNKSSEGKRYTIFHEVAHTISKALGEKAHLDQSAEWMSFSGWSSKNGRWAVKNVDNIPGSYGELSPMEDFAESIMSYRYDSKFFKERAPQKYRFLKERVFLGIEYDSESKCSEDKSYLNLFKGEEDFSQLQTYPHCADELLAVLEGEADLQKMKDCVRLSLRDYAIENASLEGLGDEFASNLKASAKKTGLNSIQPEPSSEETKEAFKKMLSEMRKSFAENYSDYSPKSSPCSGQRSGGHTHFTKFFDEKTLDDEFTYSTGKMKALQGISEKICLKYKRGKKPKANDDTLKEFFEGAL